jgi:hypothetical protein
MSIPMMAMASWLTLATYRRRSGPHASPAIQSSPTNRMSSTVGTTAMARTTAGADTSSEVIAGADV